MSARFSYLLPVLLSFAACFCGSKDGKLSDSAILDASFEGETQPKDARVLLNRRVNLDVEASLETVALIAHGDVERLVLLRQVPGRVHRLRKFDFVLREPGSYTYASGKGWVRAAGKPEGQKGAGSLGRIVRRVQVGLIESKTGPSSTMVEYLTEVPGRNRVESHLLVLTGLERSFDSVLALAEHPTVLREGRVPHEFNQSGQLTLFPGDSGFAARLRWNGKELVSWYPGEPLFVFLPVRRSEAQGASEYTFQIRNDGGPALLSYISLSFPPGTDVTPLGREPPRLYRAGATVHARGGRTMAARAPLLEATVRGWRSFHRTTLRFRVRTSDPKATVLARVVYRGNNENRLSPPERSSVSVAVDQQGYPAYVISLAAGGRAAAPDTAPSPGSAGVKSKPEKAEGRQQ